MSARRPEAGEAAPTAAVAAADVVEGGRTVLEEQREFLLRSLRDLDAEREAGDIDEEDYLALRDRYTARAAAVLRAIEADGAARPSPPAAGGPRPADPGAGGDPGGADAGPEGERGPRREAGAPRRRPPRVPGAPRRRPRRVPGGRRAVLGAGAVVVVVIAAVGALVAAGVRLPGDTVTGAQQGGGGIEQDLAAGETAIAAGRPVDAMKDFQAVLHQDPANPSALTGYGAVLVETHQAKLVAQGVVMLAEAESKDPSYGPAYAYLGEGLAVLGDYQRAERQLRTFLAHNGSSPLAPSARRLLAATEAQAAKKAATGSGTPPPKG